MQASLSPSGPLFKELNKKIDTAMGLALLSSAVKILERATYKGSQPGC